MPEPRHDAEPSLYDSLIAELDTRRAALLARGISERPRAFAGECHA